VGGGMCLVHNATQDFDCYLRCQTAEDCSRDLYGCFIFPSGEGACIPESIIPKGHGVANIAVLSNK
jgi:hypothetical protein